jgi:hypothetical protein
VSELRILLSISLFVLTTALDPHTLECWGRSIEVRRLRNVSALALKYPNASALPGDGRFSNSVLRNTTMGNNHLLEKVVCHLPPTPEPDETTRLYMP